MNIIPEELAKNRIAKRIAKIFDEWSKERVLFINLGVGIPTMVADYINSQKIFIQSENGMLGVGPAALENKKDFNLINAGRVPVTETPGCCYIDSATSFGMIRGGHIDATVIGAFQVDEEGNIANWIIPNGKQLGVGGAMDLVCGAKKVLVAMQHTTKEGKPKLVKKCNLPITGLKEADIVVTEYGLFEFRDGRVFLKEVAPEINIDILSCITDLEFCLDKNLKIMEI
ncbi:3-oxoacid CoA-transferase subunit B [Thermovenabulum gondwanense]|uniref:Butyrate--acetoacetate CoA-transferase subunit B n=1 Tax=Thermovenabulum gondwanense TaxID=520767 RepID=A0A162N076_9FIRM|nr:3-oxoacid CoA-transferase subunit B [Thermovenabulum gondwanense]KYO68620.1 Butyrate--acetoacetate CoA-transferase subunit B [Thermovenabulum gondwanense]